MPVVIAIVIGVMLLAVVVVYVIWAVFLLVPLYAYVALAIYLVVRNKRRQAAADAVIVRETERQRFLNEQEFNAWKGAAEGARRNSVKRNSTLSRFDRDRDPTPN